MTPKDSMLFLSDFIPIWGLEKITRQYIGFNDLVIKEYHDTLTLYFYDTNIICSKKKHRILFQWRRGNYADRFPYIYNTKIYFDPALSYKQLTDRIGSKEYEILGRPVKFYKYY